MLLGYRYSTGREPLPDTSSTYAYFATRVGKNLQFRIGTTVDYNGSERTVSGIITLGTTLGNGKTNLTSTYHIDENTYDIAASQRFEGEKSRGSLTVSASRIDPEEEKVQGLSGSIQAFTPRFSVSGATFIKPSASPFSDSPEQIDLIGRFGSGIYYADSIYGIGKTLKRKLCSYRQKQNTACRFCSCKPIQRRGRG